MSLKVTPQQVKEWQKKGLSVVDRMAPYVEKFTMDAINLQQQMAKAKKPKMNKTESSYAMILEARKRRGEILHYGFEEVTLKLGNDTRYTPDFFVVKQVYDRRMAFHVYEFYETKGGFIRDDSRVKFQCARKQFPFFKFRMMQLKQGQWGEIYPE